MADRKHFIPFLKAGPDSSTLKPNRTRHPWPTNMCSIFHRTYLTSHICLCLRPAKPKPWIYFFPSNEPARWRTGPSAPRLYNHQTHTVLHRALRGARCWHVYLNQNPRRLPHPLPNFSPPASPSPHALGRVRRACIPRSVAVISSRKLLSPN